MHPLAMAALGGAALGGWLLLRRRRLPVQRRPGEAPQPAPEGWDSRLRRLARAFADVDPLAVLAGAGAGAAAGTTTGAAVGAGGGAATGATVGLLGVMGWGVAEAVTIPGGAAAGAYIGGQVGAAGGALVGTAGGAAAPFLQTVVRWSA